MIRQTVLFGGYDASGASGAAGLWATNGTTAGTYEVTGFVASSIPASGFTVFNGEVFYQGGDADGGDGLWVTDGMEAGTTELGGIGDAGISGVAVGGLDPSGLTVLRNAPAFKTLLFAGEDSGGKTGLWVSNGTAAGTSELGGLGSTGISGASQGGLDPTGLTLFMPNSVFAEMMFEGFDASETNGLWVTDGTAAGTEELSGLNTAGPRPYGFVFFGVHEDLFVAYDASQGDNFSRSYGLWVTNGTAAGTTEIGGQGSTGVLHGAGDLNPIDMTVFNGEVIFENDNTGSLWMTNGTAAGTIEIFGFSGANSGGVFAGIGNPDLTVYNGKVLFQGDDASAKVGLWVTDGTAGGTSELGGIGDTGIVGAGSGGLDPSSMAVFNGEVLFNGTDASGITGLWVTNGTAAGTHELTGINGANSRGVSPLGTTAVTITIPPPEDFNGNNTSDVLFRNTTSGDTWVEALSKGAFGGWDQIGGSNTSYGVAGTGDFYGTGGSDVLFRNNSTGDTWFEAISNAASTGWHQIGGSDTSFSVAGLGDFTGYGTSDILFRDTSTGDTWFEAISNGAFNGWNHIGGSDTHYSVVGVGDFFESGTDDILFRNNSTGDTWIEAITNGASAGWDQIGGSDTHYSVVGVGDFFGNGTDDILFRNNSTGDTWFEAITNGALAGWNQIGGSDTTYSVVGVGDYFGNNTSDILFRNSAGDTWVEQITNGAFADWNQIGGSSTSYSVPVTVGPPALT